MDLVLLRSFIAVADAGSITDATERLHVSQSALSRRLQQLESDLGGQLLVRGRHGIEVTALGHEALAEARGIVARYDLVRRNIADQQNLQRGIVRIGGGATFTSFMLPGAIADFQSRYPGIRFYVREAGTSEVAASVAAGDLELGVLTLPWPTGDLETEVLDSDEIVLVARSDHPLAKRPEVEAADLADLPFVAFEPDTAIRQRIDAALVEAAVHIHVVMELRSIPTMLRMVSVTGNLAFVSRVSVPTDPGLRTVEVKGLSIVRDLALASRKDVPLSAPAEAFRRALLSSGDAGHPGA